MKVIVGLGNPGQKYAQQRHNVGFMLVDKLAESLDLNWSQENKFKSEIAKNSQLVLVKPQTFMNLSGEAVRAVCDFYKVAPSDITVIHDDVDIEFGKIKKQQSRSSAGHRGVEDIIQKINTDSFWRIRVGVGKPVDKSIDVSDWVLQNFSETELTDLKNIDILQLI